MYMRGHLSRPQIVSSNVPPPLHPFAMLHSHSLLHEHRKSAIGLLVVYQKS
jgi:hypothetical protein